MLEHASLFHIKYLIPSHLPGFGGERHSLLKCCPCATEPANPVDAVSRTSCLLQESHFCAASLKEIFHTVSQEGLLVRTPYASPEQQQPRSGRPLDGLDSTSFNLMISTQALLNAQQQSSVAPKATSGNGSALTPSASAPAARPVSGSQESGDATRDRDADYSQQTADQGAGVAVQVDGTLAPSPPPAAAGATTPSRASRALSKAVENDENRAPNEESRRSKILRRISSMRAKFAEAELQMQSSNT